MQRLDIDEAIPSLVLAVTIKDKNGDIVLMKGVELTEKHIAVLRNRDVKRLIVEGAPLKREKGAEEAVLQEVDKRFSAAGAHPVIAKIKDTIKGLAV